MSDRSHLESARAAREARDSVASSPESSAAAAAMRRYLAAEQYHERKGKRDRSGSSTPGGQGRGEQDQRPGP